MDKNKQSVLDYLESNDPLSEVACNYLLDYNEEDARVDYKESFNHTIEKSWIDLAVDVASFANTYGGYLVFGVTDKTYEKRGLNESPYNQLSDVKKVLDKISRGVQPKFSDVRTKGRIVDGKRFVFICVPITMNRIHVFEQKMSFRPEGKDPIILVRQGAIYIRKTGSNQILTSDGFEEIMQRRIQRFKNKIMDGLARVVSSEIDQEVVIVTPENAENGSKTFTVTDSSDGIKIRGAKLIVTPESPEDKVSAWIAINKSDNNDYPTEQAIMGLYAVRAEVNLSEDQKIYVAIFSLVKGLPSFYWLQGLKKNVARAAVEDAFSRSGAVEQLFILNVAGFYGKAFYERLRIDFGPDASQRGATEYRDLEALFKTKKTKDQEKDEVFATKIASGLSIKHSQQKIYELRKLDCALHAPFK